MSYFAPLGLLLLLALPAEAKLKITYERCEVRSFNDKEVELICGKNKRLHSVDRAYYDKHLGKPEARKSSLFPLVTGDKMDLSSTPRTEPQKRRVRIPKKRSQ